MIEFTQIYLFEKFLEDNLPPKVIDELFYIPSDEGYRPSRKKDMTIYWDLCDMGFASRYFVDRYEPFDTKKYILYWTKLQNFLQTNDTLNCDHKLLSLLSINQACEFLAVTRPTLYKILKEEDIPTVEVLSQKKIQLKDLVDYIEKKKKR
jgi:excisionase family DNA binding protein